MNKSDIIHFFDNLAPQWDKDMIRNDEIIHIILDNAKVCEEKEVLDVACGTGVLIPDYLDRNVKSVTAIDISQEMVKIAQKKFLQENVQIICGDIEQTSFAHKFDCIVVYNAFPHFPEPEKLIKKLITHLKPGGTLTVAHGMSREQIDRHHSGEASKVSIGLISEDALAALMEPELRVTVKISDDKMYQVTGTKKRISDETIEHIGILAKLEISEEEKERAKRDMGEMLDYIDKLNELDTSGVEPMTHVFPINNVFREDVVRNGDGRAGTLANAPEKKDGGIKVPRTIE